VDRRVHPWATASVKDPMAPSRWAQLHRSPALALAARTVRDHTGGGPAAGGPGAGGPVGFARCLAGHDAQPWWAMGHQRCPTGVTPLWAAGIVTPARHTADMASTTLRFATAAEVLSGVIRSLDLEVPTFRSPPRTTGADRTLRGRGPAAVVSVRVRNRPWPAVVADMVEGVVAANGLTGCAAGRVRAAMWEGLALAGLAGDGPVVTAAASSGSPGLAGGGGDLRVA
jgi:hypothetical protein